MKRVKPTASAATARRSWLRRAALALAAAVVATLVGCGTAPGDAGPDTTPPTLDLFGVRDGEVRPDAELVFDVVARDLAAVASVTWSSDHGDGGACTAAGGDAYTCGPVLLPPGATTITVRARDAFDNPRTLTFTVTRDATPPSLSVAGIADGSTVDTDSIGAAVTSRDDVAVAGVTWSTDAGDAGACPPTTGDTFACGPIPLVPGANTVTFTAEDAAGNRATASFAVNYAPPSGTDDTPPTLSVSGVTDGATVDAEPIWATVTSADDRSFPTVTWSTDAGDAGACPWIGADDHDCGPVPLVEGENAITFRAEDAARNATTATYVVTYAPASGTDVTPPTLSVSGIVDGATVDAEPIWATVTSADDSSFPTVTWWTGAGDAGVCSWSGGDDHDCGPIPLAVGDTTITFRAEDAAGNATTASYRVTYAPDAVPSDFEIEIVFFDEAFSASQLAAFRTAAERWESIVVGDLEGFLLDQPANGSCTVGEPAYDDTVDDLLIFATSFTDAPGGLLGSAGPCVSRSSGADAGTNAVGFMRFDTEDLDVLESNGDLVETIVHEMGHVLGIGTNWEWSFHDLLDYVASDGADDCRSASGFAVPPTYAGAEGIEAWRDLGGSGAVPVEDAGGLGTQCGHWDDATFGDELMTGYLNGGMVNPLSRLTVRSLRDLGLTVDVSAADPYALPTAPVLRTQGGFDIAAAEVLVPARGTIDPTTGEIDVFPGR